MSCCVSLLYLADKITLDQVGSRLTVRFPSTRKEELLQGIHKEAYKTAQTRQPHQPMLASPVLPVENSLGPWDRGSLTVGLSVRRRCPMELEESTDENP